MYCFIVANRACHNINLKICHYVQKFDLYSISSNVEKGLFGFKQFFWKQNTSQMYGSEKYESTKCKIIKINYWKCVKYVFCLEGINRFEVLNSAQFEFLGCVKF